MIIQLPTVDDVMWGGDLGRSDAIRFLHQYDELPPSQRIAWHEELRWWVEHNVKATDTASASTSVGQFASSEPAGVSRPNKAGNEARKRRAAQAEKAVKKP